MDLGPDPRSLGQEELKRLLNELISREQEVSSTRQVLHAQIDALRRELVDRLRDDGREVILGPDVLGSGLSARCDLGVFSERCRPDEITARIGMTPTRSRVAGELIRAGGPTVPKHMWLWEPSTEVARELNAQLDAIWSATTGALRCFVNLPRTVSLRSRSCLSTTAATFCWVGLWIVDTSSAPPSSAQPLTSTNTTTPSPADVALGS